MTIPWKATKVPQIWQKYIPWYAASLMQVLGLSEVTTSSPIKGAPLPASKKKQNQQQTQHWHAPVVATVQCNPDFRLPAHCLEFMTQDSWPHLTLMF